ncbi:MAG: cytochrome C biogenesis protein ResB [Clostridiales bacterium GWF2_36_10]|nr:MAG: cytochrome C biogenesis protein ResB [Clostridiales bacterium GWF2_36_10]HAN21201.1 cytochrome C biogenesis protein ResB [Clostridiales bacterium]
MQYLLTFLEGIISFISPCILPMIPVYITYFTGGSEQIKMSKTLKNAVGFVFGFMSVFVTLGLFAGTVGSLVVRYSDVLNIISGLIIIFFALNFLGVFKLQIFKGIHAKRVNNLGFFSALLFGVIFSISLTPCVGAFLGTALLQASQEGSALKGGIMLVFYSLGLGIPFILSALLINQLKGTFDFIKKHYKVINIISGTFLIIVGLLIISGYMGYLTRLLV